MNQGKYVFSQVIEFLSHNDFIRYVSKYNVNDKVKTFSCWYQLLFMIFGQLSNRDSLSDLIIYLQSQQSKTLNVFLYHATPPSQCTLSITGWTCGIEKEFNAQIVW